MFPVLGFLLAFQSPKPTSWFFQPVSRSLHPHSAPLLRFSFRFWVFCLFFRLQNPPRGFFNLFPAHYAHISHPVNSPRRNGRNPLPAAQIILFDYKFFLGHIFFLVNMECVQYRVLKIHQRKDQIIHLGIICQTLVLLGRA